MRPSIHLYYTGPKFFQWAFPTHFTLACAAVALTGLEKMAAEQDELMKVAEKELEELQELAKETAQVIMGFGGKQQLSVPLSSAACTFI